MSEKTERIDVKNISKELKAKMKAFCKKNEITLSEYITSILEEKMAEEDINQILAINDTGEFKEVEEEEVKPRVQTFISVIPEVKTEMQKRMLTFCNDEYRRILKNYNNCGFIVVTNLMLAEHLVENKKWVCQSVHVDSDGLKKWLLSETDFTIKDLDESEGEVSNG